jgi:hypothetical protein
MSVSLVFCVNVSQKIIIERKFSVSFGKAINFDLANPN